MHHEGVRPVLSLIMPVYDALFTHRGDSGNTNYSGEFDTRLAELGHGNDSANYDLYCLARSSR